MSGPNQPTNQPPTTYVSVRVSYSHSKLQDVLIKFADCAWYIASCHKGKQNKDHIHVLLPGNCVADVERYRKRLRSLCQGKMEVFSKLFDNGILAGIQYLGHESTEYHHRGEFVEEWITDAPQWVQLNQKTLDNFVERPKENKDRVINYGNIVSLAVSEARRNGDLSMSFKEAVKSVMDQNKFTICYQMAVHGVPDAFYKEYESRLGKRSRDMSWMNFRG